MVHWMAAKHTVNALEPQCCRPVRDFLARRAWFPQQEMPQLWAFSCGLLCMGERALDNHGIVPTWRFYSGSRVF